MAIHYYIIDTETNGTKLNFHEISEISIIRVSDKNQLTKFILIDHPERTNPQALQHTHRTMEDLKKGEDKRIVVNVCNEFFQKDGASPEERCIVGHNIIKFDKKFLFALWDECGKVFPANLWLDTIPYVKEYMVKNGQDASKTNLEAAMYAIGKTPRGPLHTAKADTQNNYILFDELQKTGAAFLHHMKRFAHGEQD